MVVAVIELQLSLPGVTSLKEKRRVLQGLLERTRRRFGASVAEVGDHDLWQRSRLGAAVVAVDAGHARKVADRLVAFVAGQIEGDVIHSDISIL